jgi:hypothetical protein
MSRNILKVARALDRDITAEKAATMLRKGYSAAEVCTALRLSDTHLRRLAADYGFRYPVAYPNWPRADEPGDLGRSASAYDNWARAVAGARATLEAHGR